MEISDVLQDGGSYFRAGLNLVYKSTNFSSFEEFTSIVSSVTNDKC